MNEKTNSFRNKKGSAMVEAAMIFPLTILAVMAVLWILVNLYTAVSVQSSGHMLLRQWAGENSGTITSELPNQSLAAADRYGRIAYSTAETGINSSLSGTTEKLIKAGKYGEVEYSFDRAYRLEEGYTAVGTHSAGANLINESAGIRRLDLLK